MVLQINKCLSSCNIKSILPSKPDGEKYCIINEADFQYLCPCKDCLVKPRCSQKCRSRIKLVRVCLEVLRARKGQINDISL